MHSPTMSFVKSDGKIVKVRFTVLSQPLLAVNTSLYVPAVV